MDFRAYQDKATKTAIYPEEMAVWYPALGLNGEAGEVAEKVKKVFRDKKGVFSFQDREEIGKELGDVLWYLAAIASDLGLSLDVVAVDNVAKLKDRQRRDKLSGSGDNR